jgi:Tol biopolymer transport system component
MRRNWLLIVLLGFVAVVIGAYISGRSTTLSDCKSQQGTLLRGRLLMSVGTPDYIIDLETCQMTEVAIEGIGRWSPDGRQVAQSVWEGGSSAYADIVVQDLTTGETTTLLRKILQAQAPDWSSTGDWLVFAEGDERTSHGMSLLAIKADGSGLHTVLNCDQPGCHDARWSNDDQEIVFRSSNGIEAVDADGHNRRVLYRPTSGRLYAFDWSPQRQQGALLNNTRDSVTLLNSLNMKPNEVGISSGFFPRMIAWSPTGDHLAILSRGNGGKNYLAVVDIHGNELLNMQLDFGPAEIDWGP